jgi:hypothetical protein
MIKTLRAPPCILRGSTCPLQEKMPTVTLASSGANVARFSIDAMMIASASVTCLAAYAWVSGEETSLRREAIHA